MLAAQQSGVTVFEHAAREVKMSTVGSGAASKQQVQAMVQRLLNLKALPGPRMPRMPWPWRSATITASNSVI